MSRLLRAYRRFLFESCDPTIIPLLRILFAVLVILNGLVWLADAEHWFTDSGVLRASTAAQLGLFPRWSLLFHLPSTLTVVQACLGILIAQGCLLLVGCWSRFQAACILVWLISFQHRNPVICDGEDTLFRVLAFAFIFLPLDCGWSLSERWRRGATVQTVLSDHAWGLRLVQWQMTVIYASATWSKLQGQSWWDGSAMYWVSQMTDHFGRVPLPTWILGNELLLRSLTWAVLVIEGTLPLLLWLRPTRRFAVAMGILLHLGIELTMHLFLFEWLMIVGLLSFVRREDLRAIYDCSAVLGRVPLATSGAGTPSNGETVRLVRR